MSRYIDIEPLMTPDNIVEEREDTGIDELPYKIRYGLNIDVIRNAPTADVVEVVRCKDCKYGEVDENENTWCTFYSERIREMPNGYCWHGERRGEDE